MLEVLESYKLIDIEGTTHKINTRDAWGACDIMIGGKTVMLEDGDAISFSRADTGEVISGRISKITGKGKKTKFKITPNGDEDTKEEIWKVTSIANDSLKIESDD